MVADGCQNLKKEHIQALLFDQDGRKLTDACTPGAGPTEMLIWRTS